MIAEINPTIGGTPEAIAMPDERGSETNETTTPERISLRKCFKPAIPFCGFSLNSTLSEDIPKSFKACLNSDVRFGGLSQRVTENQ